MEETSPLPLGPFAAALVLLLRLWGVTGLEVPLRLALTPDPPAPISAPRLVAMHSVAVLVDRGPARRVEDQCDVEVELPGAEEQHRLVCDLPLAGVHHHRLRVVSPGRGHVFLPGACPKQLHLPATATARLLTASAAEVRSPEAIRSRCGPATGVLRRRPAP